MVNRVVAVGTTGAAGSAAPTEATTVATVAAEPKAKAIQTSGRPSSSR